jgi:hypothetical protein
MTNHIKFHATSMTSPLNPHIRLNRQAFIAALVRTFAPNLPRYEGIPEAVIKSEVDRLIETGQLRIENDIVVAGVPIFEDGVKTTVRAERAAKAILKNLLDRRGIKQEIEACEPDVIEELVNTMAVLIDKSLKS